jgi:hypothetical protein
MYSLLKDDDGHSYVVPVELVTEFFEMEEDINEGRDEYANKFNERFGEYRLGYHPSGLEFACPTLNGKPLFGMEI